MPQVIVAAFYYGFSAWQFWAVVAVTAYSSYQQSSARRKARSAYNDSLKDRLISVPVVDGARARVYGRVRCADGIIFKATHGAKKENFTIVLALAGHEIDAVEQVYFNDVPVTLDGSGYVTTAPWYAGTVQSRWLDIVAGITVGAIDPNYVPGSIDVVVDPGSDRLAQQSIGFTQTGTTVTPDAAYTGSGRRVTYQTQALTSKARVRAFSGAPGQDLSTVLAGMPGITSEHKFQGIACLVIDLTYDQDAFPMGPPNVSAVVRGAKLFDPRSSTTAWTENPALIARDWALYANAGGLSAADLDDASFIAAANACDVATSFTTVNGAGSSSTQTLPLFTGGLVARTDQAPDEVLGEIVAGMAGRWAWAGGRLRLRAGAYQAPVATLTEDWVSSAGDIDVVSTVSRTDLFNVLVPSIANRDQAYVVSPIPRIAPAAYIAADGGEYPREISLAAVTDVAHAAHVSGVMLRDSRQALTVSLSCNLRALVLELFDVVAVTLPRFGWSAKPFEVLGWSFTQEGGIKLTLKETDASIYNPDASFTRADAAPNTALPNPYTVPNVAPTAIDSGNAQLLKQADGTIISRMRVTWAAVQDEAVRNGGSIELRYGPADSDPATWQTASVPGVETQALLDGVQDGRVYVVTIRARNKLVAGAWSLHQSHVVRGKSAPPSDVAGFAAASIPGAVRLSWTACPDADYALTELRWGGSWATATRIWRGTGSAFEWAAVPGSYTLLARHEDTSGNLSTGVAGLTGTALAAAGSGAALNADPNTQDRGAWTGGTLTVLADATAPTGRALEITSTGDTTAEASRYEIDPARNYQLRIHARQVSGSSTCYLGVDFQDAAGNSILGSTNAVGWPSGGTYFYFGLIGQQPPATYTQYSIAFGPSETAKIPATARYARIIILGNYTGSGVQRFSAIRLEDITAARLASDAAAAAQAAASAAQTTANTASTNASSALSTLATMRSNGYLDASEKPAVIREWLAISGERAGIVAQANAYGITAERDTYITWHDALNSYLSGLSPAYNDTSTDTPITPATDQANWTAFYNARQAVLNAISARAKVLADAAQGTANSAVTAAAAAQTTANTASTNATSALARIAAIDSDGILARGEKAATILDWQALQDEEAGIVARANGFGIVTERDLYTGAKSALATHLAGLSPAWNDTSQDTTIVPATYRAAWADVYAKRQALLNKIAEVAGQRANWTAVNGRPPEENIRNNLIDLSWWRRGGSMPWPVNSDGGVGQALFVFGPTGTPDYGLPCPGPRGGADVVLYAQEQSSNGNNAGGWDQGTFVTPLDPSKTYRFAIPIRRLGGSSTAYWGIGPSSVCNLNTTDATGDATNPYFATASLPNSDRWYLFVGYVYPYGSAGNTNDAAGIWDCKTGQKYAGGYNWNHGPSGASGHRAYQYYASLSAEQIFGRPMVNLVDGTEPSLREFFEPNAVLNEALLPTIAAERDAAIAAAAADATAKSAAAQSAAQAYAAAQASAADVSARAYADGIVDAEEARAIADAQAKATAARVAAEAAAAADATAKANLAALAAQRGAGDNLIPDPQFLSPSYWLGGWEVSTVADFTTVNAARWSGSYAGSPGVALQCNAWGSVGDQQGGRVLVEKNGVYRLRIRVFKDTGSAGVFWFGLHIPGQAYWTAPPVNTGTPTASTPTDGWNLSAIPAGYWVDYETQVQITGIEALQVQPRLRNGLTAGTVWVTMELTRVVGTSQIVADSVTVVISSFLAGPVADANDL